MIIRAPQFGRVRRGVGGVCLVDPMDGVYKDVDTGQQCYTAVPCLTGPGPLQPGQDYCPGAVDKLRLASLPDYASPQALPSTGLVSWLQANPLAMVGLSAGVLVILAAAAGGGRRR